MTQKQKFFELEYLNQSYLRIKDSSRVGNAKEGRRETVTVYRKLSITSQLYI